MTKPWRNITTIWSDKKNCVFVFISVNLTGDSTNHGLTISDFMRMTLTTVAHDGLPKYYSIPNRQLKNSIQEVIDDLSGKEKLPEARNLKELDQLLSSDDALESSK